MPTYITRLYLNIHIIGNGVISGFVKGKQNNRPAHNKTEKKTDC